MCCKVLSYNKCVLSLVSLTNQIPSLLIQREISLQRRLEFPPSQHLTHATAYNLHVETMILCNRQIHHLFHDCIEFFPQTIRLWAYTCLFLTCQSYIVFLLFSVLMNYY